MLFAECFLTISAVALRYSGYTCMLVQVSEAWDRGQMECKKFYFCGGAGIDGQGGMLLHYDWSSNDQPAVLTEEEPVRAGTLGGGQLSPSLQAPAVWAPDILTLHCYCGHGYLCKKTLVLHLLSDNINSVFHNTCKSVLRYRLLIYWHLFSRDNLNKTEVLLH